MRAVERRLETARDLANYAAPHVDGKIRKHHERDLDAPVKAVLREDEPAVDAIEDEHAPDGVIEDVGELRSDGCALGRAWTHEPAQSAVLALVLHERRSEFSSDLRVRYANADINLTLDGWQKNEQAAEMLIERARTDLHYRAAAVYFLGMLAGRGIAYDRIHPVLLNYAKHDPDPIVRQWTVEGMRYLGKGEALEELFESFTQDPSDSVRNRAGCNLSDCGNFMRLQRMRMVPKFLDVVADPRTSVQMRTWSYMALHEITDANLPADPQAWKNWYRDHGSEKLAEFERLDWWRVRGDE